MTLAQRIFAPDSEQKLYFVWTGETLAAVFSVQLHRIGHHLSTDHVGP